MYNWYVLLIPKPLKFSQQHCKTFVFLLYGQNGTLYVEMILPSLFLSIEIEFRNPVCKSSQSIEQNKSTPKCGWPLMAFSSSITKIIGLNSTSMYMYILICILHNMYIWESLVALTNSHRHSVNSLFRLLYLEISIVQCLDISRVQSLENWKGKADEIRTLNFIAVHIFANTNS